MLLSWLGPGLVVYAVDQQSTLPSDTLFGREMHATGMDIGSHTHSHCILSLLSAGRTLHAGADC